MNTLFGLGIVFHSFLAIFSTGFFAFTNKKRQGSFSNWLLFIAVAVLSSCLSISLILVATKMIGELEGSKMAVMGYGGFPVLAPIYMLLSYPIVTMLNYREKKKIAYSTVLMGIILGMPLTFLISVGLTMLGVS